MRKTLNIILMATSLMSVAIFGSCGERGHESHVAVAVTYTCPMHPQIIQDKPGTCPICGMDLVEFDRSNKDESITLNDTQRVLADITTIVVGDTNARNVISQRVTRLNARLAVDPENILIVSSRIPGRIEQLYINEEGVSVIKGQPMYRLYSEQLASLQQEYLIAAAQLEQFPADEQFRRIERAARGKLKLYGQTDQQISRMISEGKTDPYTKYLAPSSGIVSSLQVIQGQYVAEGSEIMKLENYDKLWVVADLYPSETSQVQIGQVVDISLPETGEMKKVKIEFINPDIAGGSQLLQARGSIPNAGLLLRPGMRAVIVLNQSKGSAASLQVPTAAVIRDEKGSHVWIETSKGKFVPRMIVTGKEYPGTVEVLEGIDEGDKVVATGAYLLYSEYVLKKGKNPMASHVH